MIQRLCEELLIHVLMYCSYIFNASCIRLLHSRYCVLVDEQVLPAQEVYADELLRQTLKKDARSCPPSEKCLSKLHRCLSAAPRNVWCYFFLANLHIVRKEKTHAQHIIFIAQQRLLRRRHRTGTYQISLCVLRYLQHKLVGDHEICALELDAILGLIKSAPCCQMVYSHLQFEMGAAFQNMHEFDVAIRYYTEALRSSYPRDFVALSNRACCNYLIGQTKKSIEDLEKATLSQPNYFFTLYVRADIALRAEDHSSALQLYDTLLDECTSQMTAEDVSDCYFKRSLCMPDLQGTLREIMCSLDVNPINVKALRTVVIYTQVDKSLHKICTERCKKALQILGIKCPRSCGHNDMISLIEGAAHV